MKELFLLGMPSGGVLIIILVIIMLLFGGSRLPQLAKALGQSKRAFREGQDEADEEARLERQRQLDAQSAPKPLSAVDDEALFEEARRRAALQREAQNK